MQSRREELLDLQRSLLGFDAIAQAEGLQPTETEIEVRPAALPTAQCAARPCPRDVLTQPDAMLHALLLRLVRCAPAGLSAGWQGWCSLRPMLMTPLRQQATVAGLALLSTCTLPPLCPPQAEFKTAAQDFVQQRTEFDAEKLREQVVETLRVSPVG